MQHPNFQSYFKSLGWRERRRLARDAIAGRVGADQGEAIILRDYCHFRLTNIWEQPWLMVVGMSAFWIFGFLLFPSVVDLTLVLGGTLGMAVILPMGLSKVRRKLSYCMEVNHRALSDGSLQEGV